MGGKRGGETTDRWTILSFKKTKPKCRYSACERRHNGCCCVDSGSSRSDGDVEVDEVADAVEVRCKVVWLGEVSFCDGKIPNWGWWVSGRRCGRISQHGTVQYRLDGRGDARLLSWGFNSRRSRARLRVERGHERRAKDEDITRTSLEHKP